MRHLIAALLLILFVSLIFVSLAIATPSSKLPSKRSVHSFAGEILEWSDRRDGTSAILYYCEPQHIQIWSETLDNKMLRKLELNKVVEILDKHCQKAMAGYG